MSGSRITDDMFARIPALLLEGTTKAEIAAMYGVTLGTLVVLCSQRGISLRKGGPWPKRTNLTPLPLSDGVLMSLREATRAMGKDSTARLVSSTIRPIYPTAHALPACSAGAEGQAISREKRSAAQQVADEADRRALHPLASRQKISDSQATPEFQQNYKRLKTDRLAREAELKAKGK